MVDNNYGLPKIKGRMKERQRTKTKDANSVGQQQLSGRLDAALPVDRGRADYNKARSEKE